jgi:hypothetical protein
MRRLKIHNGARGPAGPRGAQGLPGLQGLQGLQGVPGPGASFFDTALPPNTDTPVTLASLSNGVVVMGACGRQRAEPELLLTLGGNELLRFVGEFSRAVSDSNVVKWTDAEVNPLLMYDSNGVWMSGMVRHLNSAANPVWVVMSAVRGVGAQSCEFEGMILPASS